jgi:hypothetical protein
VAYAAAHSKNPKNRCGNNRMIHRKEQWHSEQTGDWVGGIIVLGANSIAAEYINRKYRANSALLYFAWV